jgi:salicylate hydroxylase
MPDGPEQEERDREMQMLPTSPGEAMVWRDPGTAPELLGYDHIADVSIFSICLILIHELKLHE